MKRWTTIVPMLCVCMASFGGAGKVLPARRPNILWICTDQQFADAMSCRMGDEHIKTPVMDRLAEGSRVFTRAYAANPICMPSRASMLSGRYPHETGIQINDKTHLDPVEFPSMGHVFSDAGYETAYIGKLHAAYDPMDPEAHGFEYTENMQDDGNRLDPATPAAAAKFLKREHDKPFLLVVSFNNPHNICEWARGQELPDGPVGEVPPLEECPPLRFNHLPPDGESDIMALMRTSYHATRMCRPVASFDEKKWREYLWAYYRMIEGVDRQVGEVLQALKDSGLEDDTLIIFLSDHGDMMGSHQWNQKTVFFDESTRVPFFLRYNGVTQAGLSDHLVNIGIDLLPTLLDFAGLPIPEYLPGMSLKAVASGEQPTAVRSYVVAQNKMVQGGEVDGDKPTPAGRMLRSQRYKYCAYDMGQQREELYDMEKDPGEMVNQAANPEYRDILARHREYLQEWCEKHGDTFPVPGDS